jgi:N-acetylglucosamine-6-phosphate deacetylase
MTHSAAHVQKQDLPRASRGPGLVDIQVNGYAGLDFSGPPELLTAQTISACCKKIYARGVTGILATLTTAPPEMISQRLKAIVAAKKQDPLVAQIIQGFHIEGVFINPDEGPRGVHNPAWAITPEMHPDLLDRLQQAAEGQIRYFSLAPELPGSADFIRKAVASGVRIGIVHHAAPPAAVDEAIAAGAIISTHLGNGCHAVLPRSDNYVQYQLSQDRLYASFIADGQHIPFFALKNFIRAKTLSRTVITTDCIQYTEMPPGEYQVKYYKVQVGKDAARVAGSPYLAGSVLTLDRAVLNVVKHCDVSFEDAWQMASTRPTELMGMAKQPEIEVEISEEGFRRVR